MGDDFFRPGRITAKVGPADDLALRGHEAALGDRGQRAARVLVRVLGPQRGTYSVTPKVKGTYRLVCLVHPTTMAETLVVK